MLTLDGLQTTSIGIFILFRQVCPLAPLLYVLATQALVIC